MGPHISLSGHSSSVRVRLADGIARPGTPRRRTGQTRRPWGVIALASAWIASLGCATGGPRAEPSGSRATQAGGLTREVPPEWTGRIVVVDFWATWCRPCLVATPNVQILHDTFANEPRVLVVGVHRDSSGDPEGYMREHGYTFPIVRDGMEIANDFELVALPTYVVLDADGREIYRSLGTMSEARRREIESVVRGALAQASTGDAG